MTNEKDTGFEHPEGTKTCPMCNRDLPISLFALQDDGTRKIHCIACKKAYIKTEDQLRDRRERFMKHQKVFDSRHEQRKVPGANVYKKYVKDLEKVYKKTEQEVRDMMDVQKGMCAACSTSLYFPESKHWPFLDQEDFGDYLICTRCSIVIGVSEGQIDLLESISDYLRGPNA